MAKYLYISKIQGKPSWQSTDSPTEDQATFASEDKLQIFRWNDKIETFEEFNQVDTDNLEDEDNWIEIQNKFS